MYNYLKFSVVKIPFLLQFYFFPILAIIFQLIGYSSPPYDLFWFVLFPISLIVSFRHRYIFKRKNVLIFLIIFLLVCFKYIIPFFFYDNTVLRALIIDAKWFYYFALALSVIAYSDQINVSFLYKSARFYCLLYIFFSSFSILLRGSFFRVELLSESNYDNLLMLLGFCLFPYSNNKRIDYLIFLIATLLSFSRTGIFSFFVMSMIYAYSNFNKRYVVFSLIVCIPVLIYVFSARSATSGTDVESIDRLIFFFQYYIFALQASFFDLVLGIYPGQSLEMPIVPSFLWYIEEFENMNNISGIFPFYFHATYIRLLFVWGIPLVVILILYACVCFFKTKNISKRMYIALLLLQAISLSLITLSSVSFFVFYIGMYLFNNNISHEDNKNILS